MKKVFLAMARALGYLDNDAKIHRCEQGTEVRLFNRACLPDWTPKQPTSRTPAFRRSEHAVLTVLISGAGKKHEMEV